MTMENLTFAADYAARPSSPCPVCKSAPADLMYVVSSEEAAQHFVLREGNSERHRQLADHIEKLWNGKQCAMRRCPKCKFGFADPFIAGDATFYNLAYERATYGAEKWDFTRTVEALDRDDFHGERVLEVGAGFGHFLDKIADIRVPRSGITALEFSDDAVRTLQEKGYCAISSDIRHASLVPGFDAIFLFQVVEHMDHLDQLFDRLCSLVTVGGRIILSVPNGNGVDFQEWSGSLLEMPPNHIGRWSRSAFQIIASRFNLEIRTIDEQPFSLTGFIRTDIAYSYLRKTQKSGTFANWTRAKRNARNGKLIGVACAIAFAPSRIPIWVEASRRRGEIHGSFWVEFRRQR
jgi:SAM-dependent methyltransferase